MALRFYVTIGLIFLWRVKSGTGSIAVPPWVDPKPGPCSAEPNGWQLLYWPLDGKCYKIFQKGYPCPESMEITPGRGGIAECQCPPGTAQYPRDAVCYKLFTKGPCELNEYFAPIAADPRRQRWGICQPIQNCTDGEVFWPKDKKCLNKTTRGPCPEGLLLGTVDGVGECICNATTMPDHYWKPSATCYEHFVQGPCNKGKIFLPGGSCGCEKSLKQYFPETEDCYGLGMPGPCKDGLKYSTIFNETTQMENGICVCKDGHVLWPDDGKCYRPFTRGPCGLGGMLEIVDFDRHSEVLNCIPLPCGPGKLYFPGGKGCHKVGTNGPCPENQVVLFQEMNERDTVSYLGVCGCQSFQSGTESYYPTLRALKPNDNGRCSTVRKLEQAEVLANDSKDAKPRLASGGSELTDDPCVTRRGMVLFSKDNTCQPLYSQGPCSDGEWVVPDRGKGQRQGRGWKMGKCECRPGYTITTPGGTICQSPSMMLAKFLNTSGQTGEKVTFQ